jgi:hypothetical protein
MNWNKVEINRKSTKVCNLRYRDGNHVDLVAEEDTIVDIGYGPEVVRKMPDGRVVIIPVDINANKVDFEGLTTQRR